SRWIGVSGGGAGAGGLSPAGLSPAGFSSAGLTGSGGDVFRVVDGAWLGGGPRSSSFVSRWDGEGVIPKMCVSSPKSGACVVGRGKGFPAPAIVARDPASAPL